MADLKGSNPSFFASFRPLPYPTIYDAQKTPVTVDITEAGLIYAFAIVLISFLFVLPGSHFREQLKWIAQILLSLSIGFVLIFCNFAMGWEVGTQSNVVSPYKAGVSTEVTADIGLYIGLRGVNITYRASKMSEGKYVVKLDDQVAETIDYNERFTWDTWQQGRIGFGPFAFEFSQQFRYNQEKGLPYPILWIAEYFTIDGEGIRWGRFYKQAGFYAHIFMWLAFPLWILTNILFLMSVRFGAYFLTMTGGSMVLANVLFASIRNYVALKIPVGERESDHQTASIEVSYGWTFWLNLVVGVLTTILGLVVFVLDKYFPDKTASFFGVEVDLGLEEDVYESPEEFYRGPRTNKKEPNQGKANGSADLNSIEMQEATSPSSRSSRAQNGGPSPAATGGGSTQFDSDEEDYMNWNRNVAPQPAAPPKFKKKQTIARRRFTQRRQVPLPAPAPPAAAAAAADDVDDDYMNTVNVNPPSRPPARRPQRQSDEMPPPPPPAARTTQSDNLPSPPPIVPRQ